MDKKQLSERDICSKFITPAFHNAGWDTHAQVTSLTEASHRFFSSLLLPVQMPSRVRGPGSLRGNVGSSTFWK